MRAGGVAEGVGPEFKPQYRNKKEKKIISFQVKYILEPGLMTLYQVLLSA
jgi:hypothetical protein